MSKKTFIHAENNNKILSSNEVRLYVPPEPEKMKVIIWGKELCSGAEWYDFLKCVEDKTKELDQLKQQLAEKDKLIEFGREEIRKRNKRIDEIVERDKKLFEEKNKEVERLQDFISCKGCVDVIKKSNENQTQLAIQELEKLKASADKWFEFWENSKYEGNIYDKLDVSNAYLQMSCEIDQQIKELKGEKDE